MSDNSRIEWTDATWNPVRGCTKISPGCTHCYAETFAERFRGVPGHPFEQGFDLRLIPEKLDEPLRWATPRMIFVNSMSDLFHEDVPDAYIETVAKVMLTANWHIYQVLTKRASRMAALLDTKLREAANQSHIWWGVSVENRKHGVPRIDLLRSTPARVPIPINRAAARELGTGQLSQNRLGYRRRRKWCRRSADGSGLGPQPSRPMSCSASTLFLQTMGRRAQERGRSSSGRADS